ncbi:HAD family hydrolase [Breoghania sp. L-A4]|uniref:sulfotransferase-like domain-containing protein n=1 Tax=Breoghania sp. L-A4 TaxID=2304600 RepID=UPI000E35CCED|nr:HAD family hydrolase [Breoghania sp. L-A4]AXS41745.1 HAD family hydrolase [Breoghania sp. L-A4]
MTIRIAMWSGPRNISTAMMRAFENRADTAVWDEPFYAAYLRQTRIEHPMGDAILAHHETDWRKVAEQAIGPAPGGAPVFYQKHMTQHMVGAFGRDWMDHAEVRHAFLIRDPESVLASYTVKRGAVTLDDIGFTQQAEIFDRVAERLGEAPPVVASNDVLADPRGVLTRLCAALGVAFDPAMLSWPAGRRDSDGVWAPHWYHAVEASTGFAPPRDPVAFETLDDALKPIAEAARPHYERLAKHRL